MPWRYVRGVQLSTGEEIEGRDWKPSGLHEDAKQELIHIMDEYLKDQERNFRELGYYTTTESLPRMEDWVDREFAAQYQHGRSAGLLEGIRRPVGWWERNWFPLIMLVMMGGGMVVIGLVNGWS